jgi:hypothetical protein
MYGMGSHYTMRAAHIDAVRRGGAEGLRDALPGLAD